jgi:hypothetical protein
MAGSVSKLPGATGPQDPEDPAAAGAAEPGNGNGEPGAPPPDVPEPGAPEAEGAESEEGEEGGQLVFGDKTTLKLAGKQPNRSQVKIRSISRDIQGQLGDTSDDENYVFLTMGRLDEVTIVNSRDAGGRVVGKIRRHTVDPFDVVKVPKELADRWYAELEEFEAQQEEKAA